LRELKENGGPNLPQSRIDKNKRGKKMKKIGVPGYRIVK
jgi:hypothetical protein